MSTQIETQFPDEIPIERLDLTVRTYNSLKRDNIHLVSQILAMDKAALMKIRNFQIENVNELREKLIAHGIMSPERLRGPFAENTTA